MIVRQLAREEIEMIWTIDRREVHHQIYQMRDGQLVNTVHFYQRCGAVVTPTPDPELFAQEPDDIHLVCPV